MWTFRWYFPVFSREYRLFFSFPSEMCCTRWCCTSKGGLVSFDFILTETARLRVITPSFSLKSAFLYFMGKCVSLIPDVSMLPGHVTICLPHLCCIMWHLCMFEYTLNVCCLPLGWSRNQFPDDKRKEGPRVACTFLVAVLPLRNPSHCYWSLDI